MKAFLISLCVAMLGTVVAVFLLLWNPAGSGADEKPVAAVSTSAASASPMVSASAVARKSVLLDANGGVIDEFSGDCTQSAYPYLCRQVRARLLAEDPQLLTSGGLTIRTTIDQRLQRAAQQAVDAYVRRDDPQIATQVLIVPGEGTVKAMVTSLDPDGGRGLQQGTTAMPYTLAAALAAGWRYDDGFPVSDEYRPRGYSAFKTCTGRAVADPSHSIQNRKKGGVRFVTLRSGTRDAVNTFFMRLQEKVGLCETVETAQRLGLRSAGEKALGETEVFTLGIDEVDPVSVANSYATLAARGRFCEPRVITEIQDDSGAVRPFPAHCEEVLDPAVADAVTDVLKDVLATSALKGIHREAAGMPGDGDIFRTAWFAGYTPGLASAVSLGDFRDPMRRPMVDVTIGGHRYAHVDGTSIPGLIWKETMTEAVRGTQETRFTPPDTERFGGCRDSCPPP
ncbi:penicillin-binding transpeptidase domain-containing protein [Microbispora hainanensis]|uniref:penicillin-binding transpeptidase domain-containing protein n=1 Tax=Microbispora hainanensis TaxID=568844 RepID=UPI0033D8FC18